MRSSRFSAAMALAAALFATVIAPPAVRAQGFFESLFGFVSPPPQRPMRPVYRPGFNSPFGGRPERNSSPSRGAGDEWGRPQASGSGSYRTLCVRMCDGYYWPISQSSTRRGFHADAGICRASCGQEARLFYHSNSSGDASQMVDLSGRAYANLPNAFLYRKSLVDGCKCKPDPWSRSELNRHRRYAGLPNLAPGPAGSSDTVNQGIEVIAGAAVRPVATVAPAPTGTPAPAAPPSAQVTAAAPSQAAKEAQLVTPPPRQVRNATRRFAPRTVHRRAATVYRPRPKKPPGGFFGLGASKLRWPGD